MLYDHAEFDGGSVSLEAGIQDMLIRMEGRRFKVFRHLNDWWDEFRLYHPQGREGRQRVRRSNVDYVLRCDDASICAHGAGVQ